MFDSSPDKPVVKQSLNVPDSPSVSQSVEPYFLQRSKRQRSDIGPELKLDPNIINYNRINYYFSIPIKYDNYENDIHTNINTIGEKISTYGYNIIDEKVGSGSYGTVYRAVKDKDDSTYIIKFIKDTPSFINELNILNYLFTKCRENKDPCPEFISYIASYEFDNLRFIIYKDAGIDLDKFLSKNPNLFINIKNNIKDQLISAIQKLHSYNIFHGDIKASNITIFNNQVKIIDFGVSSKLDKDISSWPNDNYDKLEANKILKLDNKDNKDNVDNKVTGEMNVMAQLIKDKLGITINANYRMKYLKYKLKYLALKNNN